MLADEQIRLSLLWVALMLTYLLGDVLRIFAGDFVPGNIGGVKVSQAGHQRDHGLGGVEVGLTMRAVIWTAYGPPEVLELRDVPRPAPRPDEVLIRIRATTVTAGDCEMRRMQLPLGLSYPMRLYNGIRKPSRITILGQELAGDIEAAGAQVTRFRAGDAVFGSTGFTLGAYAEYLCLRAEGGEAVLAPKPANLRYEEAAALPLGGLEALHFLRRGQVRPGEKALIIGAGGSIGTAGVQIARHLGAEVTAVDSGEKLALLRGLGAVRTLDYTCEDYTQDGPIYDVIFDVVGKRPLSESLRALKPGGRFLAANPNASLLARSRWPALTDGKRVIAGASGGTTEDLITLRELVEAGRLRPVMDRVHPLEEVVAAHRYVESGQKLGNVVIAVASALDRTSMSGLPNSAGSIRLDDTAIP
jgi:NADPH:quinone reductase-like Zn-dependent oxidoreductase